jgi:PAS domain-containing protein
MPDANIQTPQWLFQMENILEELNEGVAIADDHLRVIFANEALVRLWQYDRAEILGRTPDAIFPAEDLPFIMRQHEWICATAVIVMSFIFHARVAKRFPRSSADDQRRRRHARRGRPCKLSPPSGKAATPGNAKSDRRWRSRVEAWTLSRRRFSRHRGSSLIR